MSKEYNVIIYDKPNANRAPYSAEHIKAIPGLVEAGVLTSAGPFYKDEARTQVGGSVLHVAKNSKEEVIELLKQDIFYKEGVWDLDSALIHPIDIRYRTSKP